jgi:hypothetical protein
MVESSSNEELAAQNRELIDEIDRLADEKAWLIDENVRLTDENARLKSENWKSITELTKNLMRGSEYPGDVVGLVGLALLIYLIGFGEEASRLTGAEFTAALIVFAIMAIAGPTLALFSAGVRKQTISAAQTETAAKLRAREEFAKANP